MAMNTYKPQRDQAASSAPGPTPSRAVRRNQKSHRYALGPCIHLFGLFPILRWVMLGYLGDLTANPQEFLTRSSGIWALALLWATLSVTPIRRIAGWSGLVRHRRKLGLYSFFYTVLHVIAWALWDRGATPAAMWADFWQRDFIGIGALATLCLIPLAITSTNGWIRRLGRWWTRLHWLVYPAAVLSVWHFIWMRAGKNDFFEPKLYVGILFVLLAIRIRFVWLAGAKARNAIH